MDVRQSDPDVSEHALIVGRFPLQHYLHFIRSKGLDNARRSEALLTQEWREVQQRVADLEETERDQAEHPQMLPLPDEMIPIAQEARMAETMQRALGDRLHQWWLVEIDRAVVFQPWIDLQFVRSIQASVPKPIDHVSHIKVASGDFMTKPSVAASRLAEDRYVFTSRSTDVRFLGTTLLDPSCIPTEHAHGHATHVVAVFLGSGVNCLSAVHINNRLVLMNGSHRAYALRELGFTHVACLVTHIRTEEEKARYLPATVTQDEPRFLTSPRPPMFKDYFDVSMRKVIPTASTRMMLKLKLKQSKEIIPCE